ncbi:MAG: transglycosylase SLT domain-containing protein [Magnetococcales bacterium]|nr:transglycosylase SLT domain-containing protein [Magnetococcales bacterium]
MNGDQKQITLARGLGFILLMGMMALLLTTATAYSASRVEIKRMVVEEAHRAGLPPALGLALAKVESDFQEKTVSQNGARGVMQIRPETAQRHYQVDDEILWDPQKNVELGIDRLKQLLELHQGEREAALADYYAESQDLKLAADPATLPETEKFVQSVLRWEMRYLEQQRVWKGMQGISDTWWASDNPPIPSKSSNTLASRSDDTNDWDRSDEEDRYQDHSQEWIDPDEGNDDADGEHFSGDEDETGWQARKRRDSRDDGDWEEVLQIWIAPYDDEVEIPVVYEERWEPPPKRPRFRRRPPPPPPHRRYFF